ncbi:hypothetical protein F5146DRAFT_1006161 [Armillaria mellea]|nr:hypothetical protein F5146DRAFT_1006161 [Armillaria mellea]
MTNPTALQKSYPHTYDHAPIYTKVECSSKNAETEPADSISHLKIIVKLKIPAKQPLSTQPPAVKEASRNRKHKKTQAAAGIPQANTTELTEGTPALQYNNPWEPSYSVLEVVAQSSKRNTLGLSIHKDLRLDSPKQSALPPLQVSAQDNPAQQLGYIPSTPSIDLILFQTPDTTHPKPSNNMQSPFSRLNDAATEDSDIFSNVISPALHIKSAPASKDPFAHFETQNVPDKTQSEELCFKKSPSAKPSNASSADLSSLPPWLHPTILGGSVRSGLSLNFKTFLFSIASICHATPLKSQSPSQPSNSVPIPHLLLVSNQKVLVPGVIGLEMVEQGEKLAQLEKQQVKKEDDNEGESKPQVRPHDNIFNSGICQILMGSMGLGSKATAKNIIKLEPGPSGGGWTVDPEDDKISYLHPDWTISFAENNQYLKGKTDHDIIDQIEANFRYWKGKISKAKKVHNKKSNKSKFSDDDEGSTEQKCLEHQEAQGAANLDVPELDFFFIPVYQSTDESDQDSIINLDTDTERNKEIRVPSVRKPWITQQPLYQSTELKDCVEMLDATVQKQHWHLEKENCGKAGPHA